MIVQAQKQKNISQTIEYLHTQAVVQHKENKFEEALSFYLQSIKLDENQPEWIYGNAITLFAEVKRFNEGLELGDKALTIYPGSDEIHRALGIVLDKKEDTLSSIYYYRQAIKLNSDQPLWVYFHLTELLIRHDSLDEAIQIGQQGIRQNPESHWLYYYLGEAFAAKQEWQQAIAAYIRSLELKSDFTDASRKLDYALEHRNIKSSTIQINEINEIKSGSEEKSNPESSIVARITKVSLGGILQGWAIDNNAPEQPLKLKILVDGQPIAVVETEQVCPEIVDKFLAAAPRKFQVQLPFDLLDNQEHLFSLIHLNDNEDGLQAIATRMVVPRRGFGVVDGWVNNCLRGWVLPDNHESSPAVLEVYIDGTFYKEVKANILRQDLINNGISSKGEHGFEMALPIPPAQKTEYKVEVFFQGTKQHLKRSPVTIDYEQDGLNNNQFGRFSLLYGKPQASTQGITIVIPVFNAYEEVRQCLDSVFQHTSIDAKLIIINDASTDELMQPMLEMAVANCPNVQLVTNKKNLGYTATINRGINLAAEDDVVLLNSDTSVGPCWLQNMRVAAYHDVDIGTVTAISDNAGAFSVPSMGQANDFPVWLQPEEAVRAISHNSQMIYPQTPTGSGFCLYIRRELFQEIGVFDEEAFPRGYGEENDFCMRAIRAGWRHIVDDRTLVYHVRSASFQGEKQALYQAGREVVDKRYPEYKSLVTHFVQSPQMDLMRYHVRKLLENPDKFTAQPRTRVLFVISTKTGGTPQTNQDLMNGLGGRYHPLLLICDSKEISLYDARETDHVLCEQIKLRSPINPTSHTSKEYDNIVGDLLVRYSIELVHIRHIAWHSLSLARLAKRLNISTILSFHDFYTICPTVNLLDENLVFCGGSCTATDGRCPTPIWSKYCLTNLKHYFVKTWQQNMANMFEYVDAFVTTAPSAKALMTKIYPDLDRALFRIIPHGRDFPHLQTEPTFVLRPPKANQPLRILFPGNIGSSKGAELIVAIKKLDLENRLEFHFLGRTRHFLKSVGILHGTYNRSDFDQWMQKIRPHCVGIFSIWPETYCHTLTESWASGVPVVAINKGAVGERISRHGCGWLIDEVDPEVIYSKLLTIANDVEGYIEKISHLHKWQLTYARQNNIATMAAQYHELYQQVISASRPFEPKKQTREYIRVGVFLDSQLPPTAHIRVLEWLQHPSVCDRLDAQFLEIDAFLNDQNQVFNLDVVLIQRNIIEPHNVQLFINTCRQRNLPIIYEIDDNLLNVPPDKDLKKIYARTAPAIKTLAQVASKVIVSTDKLAQQMQQYNENVITIPNALSEFAWFKPIEHSLDLPAALTESTPELKILYLGNSSHVSDLAMIKPIFESLYGEDSLIKLFIIEAKPEVKDNPPSWYTRVSIPQERESYPNFVSWFRGVASHCDLAIAPLQETEFNQYKSNLKFLQYSAVGLPGIYSNCTPYKDVVTHNINGILTDNNEAAWRQAITQCASDRAKLPTIAEQAKKLILDQYLISDYADTYIKIFEESVAKKD